MPLAAAPCCCCQRDSCAAKSFVAWSPSVPIRPPTSGAYSRQPRCDLPPKAQLKLSCNSVLRTAADANMPEAAVAEVVAAAGFAAADRRSTLSDGAGVLLSPPAALAVWMLADCPTAFHCNPNTAASATSMTAIPIVNPLRDVIREIPLKKATEIILQEAPCGVQ